MPIAVREGYVHVVDSKTHVATLSVPIKEARRIVRGKIVPNWNGEVHAWFGTLPPLKDATTR